MVELVDAPDQNPVVAIPWEFESLFAHQVMEIDKLNSLVELYFKKCEEVDPDRPFLKWLTR